MRRWARRIAIGVGAALAVLAVLLIGAYFSLRLPIVQAQIESLLEDILQEEGSWFVRVEGLGGNLPWGMHADRIVVGDATGAYVVIDDVDVAWDLFELWRYGETIPYRIVIDSAHAATLTWSRMPEAEDVADELEEEETEPLTWDAVPRLVIDDLKIERFVLGEPVLGRAATYRAQGSAVLGEWEHGSLHLLLENEGAATSRARFDLTTTKDPLMIDAALSIAEEPDGMIAHVAGLSDAGALRADVQGTGPVGSWRTTLSAGAGRIGELDLSGTLDLTGAGTFDVSGKYDPAEQVREAAALSPDSPVEIAAAGAMEIGKALHVRSAQLSSEGRTLSASGSFQFDAPALEATLTLGHRDPGGIVTYGDVSVSSVRVHATGSNAAEQGMAFEADASARGLRIQGQAPPLLGENVTLRAAGTVDAAAGSADVRTLVLDGTALRVEGPVEASQGWSTIHAALRATSSDLSSLSGLAAMDVGGRASLRVDVRREDAGGIVADIGGEIGELALSDPAWAALLGNTVQLQARASGNLSGPLQAQARLSGAGVTADATASMAEQGAQLRADLTAVIDNLARLSDPVSASIAGRLTVQAQARGSLDDFRVDATAAGERLAYEGIRLDTLGLQATADHLPDRMAAELTLDARHGDLRASLSGNASMPADDRLVLRDVTLRGPSTSAHVSLDVDLAAGLATGTIDASSKDLSLWRPFIGTGIGGAIDVDAELGTTGSTQLVSADARAQRLVYAGGGSDVSARSLTIRADAVEIGESPRGTMRAEGVDVRSGENRLDRIDATMRGDGRAWNVVAGGSGHAAQPLAFDVAASVRPQADRSDATISELTVTVAEQRLRLAAPAQITWGEQRLMLPGAAVLVGDQGRIEASVALEPQQVRADIDVRALPLSALSPLAGVELAGTLDGDVSLRGRTLETATGEADLVARDVASGSLRERGVAPVDVEIDGRYERGRLRGAASLVGLSDTTLRLDVNAPLGDTAQNSQGLEVRLRWNGDLAEARALLPPGQDVVRGRIDADLVLAGSTSSPRVDGSLFVRGGAYENAANGVLLRDLTLDLAGRGSSLVITELRATDGDQGTIAGSGRVQFEELPAFDAAVDLEATDAMLARTEMITAQADARIAVRAWRRTGQNDVGGEIRGEVHVDEARVRPPNSSVKGVPRLDVIEIEGGGPQAIAAAVEAAREEERGAAAEDAVVALALDIGVRADNRIYVEARTLTSEWRADLHVGGTTAQPLIRGDVRSVRGELGVLGRRFDLREATLRFDGTPQIEPYLDMTAEAEAGDITAIVDIRGPATKPEVVIRSEPALPRDEVLARVLFGRNFGELSPLQTVQLARSVNELAGGPFSGGPGVLNRVGRGIGLESLSLETAESGGGALSATKYLTDDVYIRYQQGLTPEDSKAVVEWEIFKNITIQSDISQDATGEIGVMWRKNY